MPNCNLKVCIALAIGEKMMEFEHRDLHTGNILCLESEPATKTVILNDEEISFKNHGINIFIIDYSLSSLRNAEVDIAADLCHEKSLFEGEGDHQFEVYRMMQNLLENKWINNHQLKTNIFWLEYLIEKLKDKSKNAVKKHALKSVNSFFATAKRNIMKYDSCLSFVSDFLMKRIN